MYKVGDVVIYKRDVCKIQNIKEAGSGTRYYIMNPIDDLSLTIKIPVDGTFLYVMLLQKRRYRI